MNKLILTTFFVICAWFSFSQSYSYSFEGNTDPVGLEELKQKILELPKVNSCEIKYKSDSHRGEILFSCEEQTDRKDEDAEFSPVFIKSLLLDFNLAPLDFRKIK